MLYQFLEVNSAELIVRCRAKVATRRAPKPTPAEGYLGCCDAIAALDFSAALPRIRARTLVVAGGADAGTPPAMSEAIAKAIPGARLQVLPGAAHLSAVEHPRDFGALVGAFLSQA